MNRLTGSDAAVQRSIQPTRFRAMPLTSLPRRKLERAELEALVERIERRAELWRPSIDYSDSARHFASLHRDEHVDIWLLCWTTENDTGWHDHDISSGAVRVVEGA